MGCLGDDYFSEFEKLKGSYKTLRKVDPNNRLLQLVSFEEEDSFTKPEFWEEFGSMISGHHYGLRTLIEANKKLKGAIKNIVFGKIEKLVSR